MDRRVHAEEDRDLDGARRVQPAVGVAPEARAGLRIVDGDGDRMDAGLPLEGVDVSVQPIERGIRRRRRAGEKGNVSGHEVG